jgi:LysM repeat protein
VWTISKKYNVSIAELKSWNSISNTSQIKPGKKLIMYPTGLASLKQTSKLPTSSTIAETGVGMVVHTVKPGDTLWEIARKYNVSATQIEDLNGKKKNIKPGDRLKIRPKSGNES